LIVKVDPTIEEVLIVFPVILEPTIDDNTTLFEIRDDVTKEDRLRAVPNTVDTNIVEILVVEASNEEVIKLAEPRVLNESVEATKLDVPMAPARKEEVIIEEANIPSPIILDVLTVEVRMVFAVMEDVTKVEILIIFAIKLEVISSAAFVVTVLTVDAVAALVIRLLVPIDDTSTLSEGTNRPFVDVVKTRLLDTGKSSSCNRYVLLVELLE
jgi:hypothetical protein